MNARAQNKNVPPGIYAGIFLISAATLLLELTLTKIFDVILMSNLAYLMVSCAMFGFGLGGMLVLRWPMTQVPSRVLLAATASAFFGSVLLLFPLIQLLPLDLSAILEHPIQQFFGFGLLYVGLVSPFLFAGVAISLVLTRNLERVHQLYFWDLVGAGVGCLGIFVLPWAIGGEETLLAVAGAGAASSALFAPPASRLRRWTLAAAVLLTVLTTTLADRITFPHLRPKRGVLGGERIELSRWDPVSKIDVITTDDWFRKRITYDGGSQSSNFRQFDGDFEAARDGYFEQIDGEQRYNSGRYIALLHWLKRDSNARSLVIGSAGGQETLAALVWGAGHVDAVDMVCAVIEAARGPFADFIGRIFSDPRVTVRCDEGRSFLRRGDRSYDIIQIHSNHTTSSIANGTGGAAPIYLQTVEAYKDYITHLTPDGVLQVNYFVYTRLLTTAGLAWSELFPGDDFRSHVVITDGYGIMKTFLLKRSPWTSEEIAAIRHYLSPEFAEGRWQYGIIFARGEPEAANVPDEFFEVPIDPKLVERLPYKVEPVRDNRPFYRDLRKSISLLEPDEEGYVPDDVVGFLNPALRGFIPMESAHLYILGGISVIIAAVLLCVPLLGFRKVGVPRSIGLKTLLYFGCLGSGFVIIELVLIYKLVLLLGPPIYSMATVIFVLLVAAGTGSALSARLEVRWGRGAIAVLALAGLALIGLVLAFPVLRDSTLGLPLIGRMALVSVLLLPVGLPLGMPFPLGMAAVSRRFPTLTPWAWGINALMTVVGSLLAVLLSMRMGFDLTLMTAVGIYAVAAVTYLSLTRNPPSSL